MTDHIPTGVLDISDAYIPRNLILNELDVIHEDGTRDDEPTILMTVAMCPVGQSDKQLDLKLILPRSAARMFAESILDGLQNLEDQD